MANTTGFKARVEYEVTDGTQTTYTFPFLYLRKKFVIVSILHSDSTETALEYGVDYTVNNFSVSLTTPAQVGEHIIIYRQTSTDRIVKWNDCSILLARDMNTEDAQLLHLQEEQLDYLMAHAISTKVTSDKEVLWDALNHRVINVSDPKDPQDAVTKNYMETVQGGFVEANTILVNAARVSEQNAAESARVATEHAMDFNMLKRNKAYSIGDIAYSSYLPSWARLECVTAGTTADTVPLTSLMVSRAGLLVSDGTVTWIVDDTRDGNRVCDIVLKPTLNDGYIKANGATVKASEYPRLLKFAQDNNLCVSDSEWSANSATKYVYNASEDTLKIPNVVGRVLQGATAVSTKEAGLPNIDGLIMGDNDMFWVDGGAFDGGRKTSQHPRTVVLAQSVPSPTGDTYRSKSLYGASDTVQPPACCLIVQIKY